MGEALWGQMGGEGERCERPSDWSCGKRERKRKKKKHGGTKDRKKKKNKRKPTKLRNLIKVLRCGW